MTLTTLTSRVDAAIRAVAPIDGVSIGNAADKATWTIQFAQSATAAQKTQAASILATYVDVPDELSATLDDNQFKVLLNHENRIRVLESKASITPAQFKAALKVVLGG